MPPSPPPRPSRRSFLLGVAAAGAAAAVPAPVAGAASTDDWERLWEIPMGAPQQTPAAFDETVFVPSGGVVRAVDPETGDAAWARTVDGTVAADGLLATAERLFVGTEGGTVHCLSVADGESLWSTPVGAAVEGLAEGGPLVVGTAGALYGLDPAEGAVRWRTPIDDDGNSGADHPVPPVVEGGAAIGSRGATVVALAPDSGEVEWVDRRPADDAVWRLAVADDVVVVAGERTTAALTVADGAPLWTHRSGTTRLTTAAGSSVYAMGANGTVALDPESGRVERSLSVRPTAVGGLGAGEVEPHGTVLAVSGELDGTPTLLVVDPTSGDDLWRLTGNAAGAGFGAAVIADERLIVQDHGRGVAVAHGEPFDESESGAGASGGEDGAGSESGDGSGGSGTGGSGLLTETAVAAVSLVVAVVGGAIALAQLLQDRKRTAEGAAAVDELPERLRDALVDGGDAPAPGSRTDEPVDADPGRSADPDRESE